MSSCVLIFFTARCHRDGRRRARKPYVARSMHHEHVVGHNAVVVEVENGAPVRKGSGGAWDACP